MRFFSRNRASARKESFPEERYNLSDDEDDDYYGDVEHTRGGTKRTEWPRVKKADSSDDSDGEENKSRKKKKKKKKKKKGHSEDTDEERAERKKRRAARKKAKRRAEREVREAESAIRTVPTAHSYNSDDSEEDYLDERSRCSRYTTSEDAVPPVIWSDEENDDDGRYSRSGRGTDSLWGEESENSSQAKWRSFDDGEREAVPAVEGNFDPTYDSVEKSKAKKKKSKAKKKSKKKKKKKKKRKSKSPASGDETDASNVKTDNEEEATAAGEKKAVAIVKSGISKDSTDPTVLTDPLDKMLNASEASDAGKKNSMSVSSSKASDPAKKSNKSAASSKASDPAKKNKKSVASSKTSDPAKKSNKSVASSKASDKAKKSNVSVASSKASEKKETKKEVIAPGKPASDEKQDAEKAKLAEKAKQETKQDAIELDRSVSLPSTASKKQSSKKQGVMYTKSLMSEESWEKTDADDIATKKSMRSTRKQLPRATSRDELARGPTPMELDEYSYTPDANSGSALVQCLRFYYCDAAANLVDFRPKELPYQQGKMVPPVENLIIDDVVMSQRIGDAKRNASVPPISPGPKFEVVLDENSVGGVASKASIVESRGMSDLDSSDEELEEAPDLASLSRCPSMVLEVSGKALQLDDDSDDESIDEPKRKPTRRRRKKKSKRKSDDEVSVTSIEIPSFGQSQDDTTLESPISSHFKGQVSREEDTEEESHKENQTMKQKKRPKSRKGWLSLRRARSREDERSQVSSVVEFGGKNSDRATKKRPARTFLGRMRRNRRGSF